MELRSWGAWTSSYHTPAGTKVEFLATSSGGGQSQSAPFTWLDGDLSNDNVPPGSPPPPPPPSSGNPFNATFTIKSPNSWWQEVFVAPNPPQPLAKVEVRTNGGSWRPMELRSWGAWTSSYHTPAGTKVEFLATNTGGGQSQSAPFTWLDGNLTKPSVPPGSNPPPSQFSATFTPRHTTNNWWVEVVVTSSQTVVAVDAQVNGGSWTALSKTSWGTWAKSFFVADGATVKFRAANAAGDTVTSDPYVWG